MSVRRSRPTRAAAVGLWLAAALGAGPLRIDRVEVPAGRLDAAFGPGAEVVGLPAEEFGRLLRRAERAREREGAPRGPRLLRAEHRARWEDGSLTGTSELVVRGDPWTWEYLDLGPWTPALEPSDDSGRVVADDRGRVLLRVGRGEARAVRLSWSQPAPAGDRIELGLGRTEVASWAFDVPEGMRAELEGGLECPAAGEHGAGRAAFRFDGAAPEAPLAVRIGPGAAPASRFWIRGDSEFELTDGPAAWRAAWTVERGEFAPAELVLTPDEGLEVSDVRGPDVLGFRLAAEPGRGRRLVVRLRRGGAVESSIELRGMTRPPPRGAWRVPAAVPEGAIWTGGRTTIRVRTPSRRVEAVRELAGQAVAAGPGDEAIGERGALLNFEATGPGSVAELVLGGPEVRTLAEVRGLVRLGGASPTLEAELSWVLERGRADTLEATLSAGWEVEDVRPVEPGDPASWRSEPEPGGGRRLRLPAPAIAESGRPAAYRLIARWTRGPAEDVTLPRIAPLEARVADERWTASIPPGVVAIPLETAGLAWLDAAEVAPPAGGAVVGWRWLGAEGSGRLRLIGAGAEGMDRVVEVVNVGPGGIEVEYRLLLGPGGPPGTVGFTASRPLAPERGWESAAARATVSGSGPSWSVARPAAGAGPLEIRGRAALAPEDSGAIPLLRLDGAARSGGLVLVLVEEGMGVRAEPEGLEPLPVAAATAIGRALRALPEPDGTAGRVALAFTFDPAATAAARLAVRAEDLEPVAARGVVVEAWLRTLETAGTEARNDLDLTILAAPGDPLRIALPAGARPLRLAVDGAERPLVVHRGNVEVALRGGERRVRLEYLSRGGRPEWPGLSLPRLAATTIIETPDDGAVAWPPPVRPGAAARRELMAEWLARLPEGLGGGVGLGDLLLRLDRGPAVAVDRLGLAAAGWSPQSIVRPTERDRSGPAMWAAFLDRAGLSVIPAGAGVVVTARPVGADIDPGRVASEVIRAGVDRDDRFTTLMSWLSETAGGAAGASEAGGRFDAWERRLIVGDEGEPTASDRWGGWRAGALGWALGLGMLAAGVAGRGRRVGRIGVLLAAGAAAAAVFGRAGWSPAAAGPIAGGLAAGGFWLAWAGPRPAGRSAGAPAARSSARGLGILLAAGALAGTAPARSGRAQPQDGDGPIVVVSETGAPGRVYLSRGDYDRLLGWAEADEEAPRGLVSEGVEIRVLPEGAERAVIENRFELAANGRGRQAWTWPIAGGLDVSATLDGEPCPVEVLPGERGRVWIDRPGPHRLVARRTADLEPSGAWASLEIGLGRDPRARLVVEPSGLGPPERREGVAGRLRADGRRLVGPVGPAERVRLKWRRPEAARPESGPPPAVEATVLWDALPAGDLVRVRLVSRGERPLEDVRLDIEPGLVLRSAEAVRTRTGEVSAEGSGGGMTLRVDPPLEPGEALALECWRGRSGSGAGRRSVPRIAVRGAAPGAVTLGFRRPSGWRGRLEAGPGCEAVPDETFARSWGAFPELAATFAGAIRYSVPPEMAVETGPAPARAVVRPSAVVEVQAGRLLVRVDAEVAAVAGRVESVTARMPEGWRTLRVSGDGVRDWSPRGPESIRVELDPTPTGRWRVRLEGWIPAPPEGGEVDIPWPGWPGCDRGEAEITLIGPAGSSLSAAISGAEPGVASGPAAPGMLVRGPYLLMDPGGSPGTVSWTAAGPAGRASLRAGLTVMPGSAELQAVVRHRLAGAPQETFAVSLPTAWAEGAEVGVAGLPGTVERIERGEATIWTVRLERPVLGVPEVIVRARRPFDPAEGLVFPRPIPRGAGSLEARWLSVANATGGTLSTEGKEVQEVAGMAAEAGRPRGLWPGVPTRTYQVLSDGWRIALKPERGEAGGERPFADVSCALLADGRVLGCGRYAMAPGGGPSFRFRAGPGAEVVATAVDGRAVVARAAPDGSWLVPLGDGKAETVEIAWRAAADRGGLRLGLPVVDGPVHSGLLTLFTPETARPEPVGGGWLPLPVEAGEVVRAEAAAEAAARRVGRLDRSSREDLRGLVAGLEAFGRHAWDAERAAGSCSDANLGRALKARLGAARKRLRDELELAGLADLGRGVRTRLEGGSEVESASPPGEPAAGLGGSLRVPQRGRVHRFALRGRPGPDSWRVLPAALETGGDALRRRLGLGLVGGLGMLVAVGARGRAARLALAAGVAASAALVLPWGPLAVLAGAWLGWGCREGAGGTRRTGAASPSGQIRPAIG